MQPNSHPCDDDLPLSPFDDGGGQAPRTVPATFLTPGSDVTYGMRDLPGQAFRRASAQSLPHVRQQPHTRTRPQRSSWVMWPPHILPEDSRCFLSHSL